MDKVIQVFVVDDHPLVIDGIYQMAAEEADIVVTGNASCGKDALSWLEDQQVDVIILDIGLPDMDGIQLCKRITQQFPSIHIIGLTSYDQISFTKELLRAGAKGYLYKSVNRDELLKAIRTVASGEQYLTPNALSKLIGNSSKEAAQTRGFIPRLTRREKEVLQLIVEEYTNQEIADRLCISVSTVETHRMNACTKLGVRNTAGLVRKALQYGLIS